MSYLESIASYAPTWPQILGVLLSVWLVFGWALWAHPRREPAGSVASGRHRPERIAALAAPAEAAAAFRAAHRQAVVHLAAQVRVPAHLLGADHWTSDVPTRQLSAVVDAGAPTEQLPVVYEAPRMSAADRARARWGDCPLFTSLAAEVGYDPDRGFDGQLVAA